MSEYNAQGYGEIFAYLTDNSMLEYGAIIPVTKIQSLLGITIPELGTKAEFTELELIELGAVEYIRRLLIKDGKYFGKDGSAYRILLPSENAKKVNSLMESASRKLRRADTLRRATPNVTGSPPCNTAVRIAAKQAAIKEAQDQANLMS